MEQALQIMIQLGYIVFIYILMYAFHELGHWLVLKAHKVKHIKFKWNRIEYPYYSINKKKKQEVLLAGLILGAAPILLIINYNIGIVMVIFACYLYGARKDIYKIDWGKLAKDVKEE